MSIYSVIESAFRNFIPRVINFLSNFHSDFLFLFPEPPTKPYKRDPVFLGFYKKITDELSSFMQYRLFDIAFISPCILVPIEFSEDDFVLSQKITMKQILESDAINFFATYLTITLNKLNFYDEIIAIVPSNYKLLLETVKEMCNADLRIYIPPRGYQSKRKEIALHVLNILQDKKDET